MTSTSSTGTTATPYEAPGWARTMHRVTDHMLHDFLGGPRPWKFSWVINFQKAGTFVFLLALIAWYGNTSTQAWVYTAMQGSYGLVWILKDIAFPDPNWQRRITIAGGVRTVYVFLHQPEEDRSIELAEFFSQRFKELCGLEPQAPRRVERYTQQQFF